MIVAIGNLVMGVTFLASWAFVVTYPLRAPWWRTPTGWVMLGLCADLGLLSTLAVVRAVFGASLDVPWFAALRLGLSVPIPISVIALGVLMWRSTRRRPATHPLDPRDQALIEAWGIIANVSGSRWDEQAADWQTAAGRWRDRYLTLTQEESSP